MTLLPLVLLADVEQQRAVDVVEARRARRTAVTSSISSLTWARSSRYVAITFQSIALPGQAQVIERPPLLATSANGPSRVRRLPSTRERPHPHDPRGRRARRSSSAVAVAGITAATSDEPPGAAAAGPTVRERGAAALARPRRPRRPRGGRPARGASPLRGRQARARPRSCSRGTTRSRRESARRSAAGRTAPSPRLTQLSGLHPKSAAVQLNLGHRPLLGRGGRGEGRLASRPPSSSRTRPTPSRPGTCSIRTSRATCPIFVPSTEVPAGDPQARRARRSSRCSSAARATGTVADRLFYGVALQRLGKQRSAERVYAAAATARAEGPGGAGGCGRRALRQGAARPRRSPGSAR